MNKTMSKIFRRVLLGIQLVLLVPILWFCYHVFMPRNFHSLKAERITTSLSSGPFEILYYASKHPRGIMIVATGDGGWSNQWEEPTALHAATVGYAVGGWDCRKFSESRSFGHDALVESFNATVEAVRKRAGLPADCPVWYTGWSTGAEWAVAAAASSSRDPHLVGILAVSPSDRSRYGITQSDLLGLDPQGPGSYALADHAPALHGLRVVQFAGGLDPLDESTWLKSLHKQTPHKLVEIPDVPHDMDSAGAVFLTQFDMAIQWTLDTPVK